jgi:4-hydroxybenzoate polyprenyltransferase
MEDRVAKQGAGPWKRFAHGVAGFARLARFDNALLPAVAVTVGFAAHDRFAAGSLTVRLMAVVLLHSAVTVWNDIADEGGDAHNGIHRIASLKRSGSYPAVVCLTWFSAAAGVLLSAWLPSDVRFVLIALLAAGWAYNAPPIRASLHPNASIAVLALAYGLLPFLAGSGLRGLSWQVWLLAAGWACVRASLSLLKDYKDATGDAKADKKTFLLVYGNVRTLRFGLLLSIVGYALCVAMTGSLSRYPAPAAASLGAVALWLLYERRRLFREHTYAQLNRRFHVLLEYELVFDCLAAVWLLR